MGSDFNLQCNEYDYEPGCINISDRLRYETKVILRKALCHKVNLLGNNKNTISKDTGNSQSLSNHEPLSVFCIVQI